MNTVVLGYCQDGACVIYAFWKRLNDSCVSTDLGK